LFKAVKKYRILTIALIFFLIINTQYFWESKLGIYAIPLALILFITFVGFGIILFYELYLVLREKFRNKTKFISIGGVSIVFILSFFYPFGVINFQKFEVKDLLIAEREGSANCLTILKLKANNKFVENSFCFGMIEVRGEYSIKGDSIFFSKVKSGRGKDEYYQFAVIERSEFQNDKTLTELKQFKNYNDTLPQFLFITKNELNK